MIRVWGMVKKKQRITSDYVAEHPGMAELPAFMECLQAICAKLDVPRPVVLGKHERELMTFGRTRFAPSDFMETVSFDHLEMELLADKKKERKGFRDEPAWD